MAVHVRYNSWYISLPSSAKQQREMTKVCVRLENTDDDMTTNLSHCSGLSSAIVFTVVNKVRVSRDS